jgi:hypothetical protein
MAAAQFRHSRAQRERRRISEDDWNRRQTMSFAAFNPSYESQGDLAIKVGRVERSKTGRSAKPRVFPADLKMV